MDWFELSVHTTGQAQDIVGELLMEKGATGTQIFDRADIPDPSQPGVYWELYDQKLLDDMPKDVVVKAWFDARDDEQKRALLSEIAQGLSAIGGTLESQTVMDGDWAQSWKKYYKPFKIGEKLIVKPSWEAYDAEPGDIIIKLDPGMAFGSGTHETTYMCMELAQEYMQTGMRVMDVGTGSGILAIAAAKLGAKDVLAIDIDPDAVKVAKENIEENGVSAQVRAVVGDLVKSEAMPCELAMANIVANAICMLAEPMTRHLVKGGVLICSGIIKEREQDVMEAVNKAGYTVLKRLTKGEWVALALKNEG